MLGIASHSRALCVFINVGVFLQGFSVSAWESVYLAVFFFLFPLHFVLGRGSCW